MGAPPGCQFGQIGQVALLMTEHQWFKRWLLQCPKSLPAYWWRVIRQNKGWNLKLRRWRLSRLKQMAAISIFIAASHCFLRHLWSKSVHERQKSKIPMQLSTYFEQRILNFGLLCDFGRKRAEIQEYQFWRWCHIKPVLMKWGHKTKEWTPLRWEPSIFSAVFWAVFSSENSN